MTKLNQATALILSTLIFSLIPLIHAQDKEETKEEETEVEIGKGIIDEAAPELQVEKWFQLPQGKTEISIKDYKDKVLVMLFFQSTGSANDIALPKLKALADHYKDNDKVKFLLIQTAIKDQLGGNSPAMAKKTAEENGFKFPVGHYNWSPNFPGMVTVQGTYKNTHLPWFIVVGPDGKVKFNGVPFKIDADFAIKEIDAMLK